MASNLRAKPIEGNVTDSAGNILRNSQIVVKQVTPQGSYSVDSVNSDDSGYFKTKPIPNGSYDIYESGIVVAKTIHKPDENAIQAFKAHQDNFNIEDIGNFSYLASIGLLSNFKSFIQIESPDVDVEQYGSLFPIYDKDIASNATALEEDDDELWNLAQYYGFDSASRLTTTRFDVEYYTPITAISKSYHRIRWAGVPAIKFRQDSKLVIPLDYFSIVLNLPRVTTPDSGIFLNSSEASTVSINTDTLGYVIEVTDNSYFKALLQQTKIGDILKCYVYQSVANKYLWYGVVTDFQTTSGGGNITLEELRSSRFTSEAIISGSNWLVAKIYSYDGMFAGISEVNEEVNERFTVTENTYAQDNASELYNYNDRYIV